MKLTIKTPLRDIPKELVKKGFNRELFLSLNPPLPKVDLQKFDGCKTGDQVSLKLNFIFFSQTWSSDIIDDFENEETWYFVDKGMKLPFFLKSWHHKHIVNSTDTGSEIIDDIEYTTGTILTDIIFYPAMIGQFAYRIPKYKRYFKKLQQTSSISVVKD